MSHNLPPLEVALRLHECSFMATTFVPSMRLRTRLVLMAIVAVLPALIFIAIGQMNLRARTRAQIFANNKRLAVGAAAQQAGVIRGVRRLLTTLSQVPAVRAADPRECDLLLPPVRRDHPEYVSLFVVDAAGSTVCASTDGGATPPASAIRNSLWFARAFETRAISLGGYTVNDSRATVVIALPLLDAAGRVERIIAAEIRLDQLPEIVPSPRPEAARFTLYDRRGVVLATVPLVDALVGTRVADEVLARSLHLAADDGMTAAMSIDGRARLYAMAPVVDEVEPGLFVSIGLERAAALTAMNGMVPRQLSSLALILVLVAAAAALGGEIFVLRPVRALQAVTARIAAGDLRARAELSRALPGLLEVGGAVDTMAVALDARERARDHAEQHLRASEDQYRLLFDDNPQAMWIYDPETLRFLAVNRTACDRYGYTADELLRLSIKDLHAVEDHAALDAYPSTGEPCYRGAWQHRTKDGRIVDVEVQSHRIRWWGNHARLAIAEDITERRELEAQLRQSQKMDAIGQLAGGVAHDFNNLLTAIQGYTDLLADKLVGEEDKQADLDEIRLAARRAATLTRQLLAFSRKQHLSPKTLRVADVVAGIVPMLTRLIGETVDLKTTASGRGVVVVDEGQLEQILVNLIVNARDAMPDGGRITIETSDATLDQEYGEHHPGVVPGRYVMLAVSDTGCGMDQATRERAFEPFFSTKPKDRGTGLGLATVYGIVKQTGGHIRVYSEVGRGTTFRIYLPLSGEMVEVGAAPARAAAPGGTERILLVEDEEMVREYVRRMLKRKGYHVLVASGPLEALAIAERETPPIDLLVTDVVLPVMTGPALAVELRRSQPRCRVLYMSGYTANAIVRQGWHDADMDFLQKPFSQDALSAKVREVLDRTLSAA